MSRRLVVRGRRPVRRVYWEAHQVTLYMHVGGGSYERIKLEDPIVCVAGEFPKAFAAMNIPGFPEYDAFNPDIERELVYEGVNFPSAFEIERYLAKKMQTAIAGLRERFLVKD